MAAVQDGDDDVRSEKIQPHQSRGIRRPHVFLRADIFRIGGGARCEAAGERMGSDGAAAFRTLRGVATAERTASRSLGAPILSRRWFLVEAGSLPTTAFVREATAFSRNEGQPLVLPPAKRAAQRR